MYVIEKCSVVDVFSNISVYLIICLRGYGIKGEIPSKRPKSYLFYEHGLKKNYNRQKHQNLDFCSSLLLSL